MVDVERVYHSCRLNESVTREVMILLQKVWNENNRETVRVRLLTIILRLFDKLVFNPKTRMYSTLIRWLHYIEANLDPYINKVLRRQKREKEQWLFPCFHSIAPHIPTLPSLLSLGMTGK